MHVKGLKHLLIWELLVPFRWENPLNVKCIKRTKYVLFMGESSGTKLFLTSAIGKHLNWGHK